MTLLKPKEDGATGPGHGPRSAIIIPAIGARGEDYPIEKMAAHRSGQLHWAVSVFVFSGDEMLIQRRAAAKYHCGGLWANACCTHPNWGEDLAHSARRRVREELGAAFPLSPRAIIEYEAKVAPDMREHERVQIFRAEVDRDQTRFHPDPDEVDQLRWASVSSLKAEARATPERFAPWFRIYLERWDELDLDRL